MDPEIYIAISPVLVNQLSVTMPEFRLVLHTWSLGKKPVTHLPCAALTMAAPASNFQRRFAMFRDVMRVKTSAREGSREVYILREVS